MFMFSEFSTDKSVRTCYCGKLYLITPRLRLSVAPSGITPGSTPQSRAALRVRRTARLRREQAVADATAVYPVIETRIIWFFLRNLYCK